MKPGTLIFGHPKCSLSGMFHRSVIMITENYRNSHSGLILNRELQGVSERDLLRQHEWETGDDQLGVRLGGPVNRHSLAMMHPEGWHSRNTLNVCAGISISSDPEMIESVARGLGPHHRAWFCGISGWEQGQLEAEMEGQGAWAGQSQWLMIDHDRYDPDEFVWHTPARRQWTRALEIYSQQQITQWF